MAYDIAIVSHMPRFCESSEKIGNLRRVRRSDCSACQGHARTHFCSYSILEAAVDEAVLTYGAVRGLAQNTPAPAAALYLPLSREERSVFPCTGHGRAQYSSLAHLDTRRQ